jgi:hypothetical protein
MEEYFYDYIIKNIEQYQHIDYVYIPAFWTNLQVSSDFGAKREYYNEFLKGIYNQYNGKKFFTIVQHDDCVLLNIPNDTLIFGACSGHVPLPLIYEDTNNTLENMQKKCFNDKSILCSFVGNITSNSVMPNVRQEMFNILSNNENFKLINLGGWTPEVNKNLQNIFIETTINSKFALAPRGYGRASFRFYECFQLGTIPIYIWNDINWLPFQNKINYEKLCIVIHVSKLHELYSIISYITEEEYINMFKYYQEIKHLFTLDGMSTQIIEEINS